MYLNGVNEFFLFAYCGRNIGQPSWRLRKPLIGPSVDDQAVSLSDDGTTIIINFFSFLFFFFSLLLSTAVVKIPEGVVVGFQIFAWAPKKK